MTSVFRLGPWVLMGVWIFAAALWLVPPEAFAPEPVAIAVNAYRHWAFLTTLSAFAIWVPLTVRALWLNFGARRERLLHREAYARVLARRRASHRGSDLEPSVAEVRRVTERNRQRQDDILEGIDSLSMDERWVLTYCILRNQRTVYMRVHARVALSLKAKGFLTVHGGVDDDPYEWPFTVPALIWDYLRAERPMLLPAEILDEPTFEADLDRFINSLRGIPVMS